MGPLFHFQRLSSTNGQWSNSAHDPHPIGNFSTYSNVVLCHGIINIHTSVREQKQKQS